MTTAVPAPTARRDRLDALLRPRAVAVVGASERLGNGRNAVENLIAVGYPGAVYPINPRYREVLGRRCYPSLDDLPETPDAVYVAVGAAAAVEAVRDAGARGIAAAVVHAGGFAESGEAGAALQAALVAAAEEFGMAVCGPNCLGLVNVHDRTMLYGASMPRALEPGGIGAVFQSGSTLLALMNAGRDLRFSHLISSGNEAVLDATDYFDVLIDDPDTRVVIGFIDGFRQPQRLLAVAARAAAAGKPIVLLKPGRSEAGRKAALAHTGALAGSDQVLEAVFRRHGIVRAHDLDELAEMATLFSSSRRPAGRGGLVVTAVSGGEMAVVLDAAADEGLTLPPLSDAVTTRLRAALPPHVAVANPLDVTATGLYEPDLYRDALVTLASDPGCAVLAVSQDMPGAMGDVQAERYRRAARAFVAAAAQVDKPVVVFSNLSGDTDPQVRAILAAGGVPFLLGTRESLKAIARFLRFARPPADPEAAAAAVGPPVRLDPAAVAAARSLLRRAPGPLSEQDSKAVLARCGVRVPGEIVATSAAEAAAAVDRLGGPVVMKIASADIPHKTEAGGVRLGITSPAQAAAAFAEIVASARTHAPAARIDGVAVQEQVTGGVEMIVGCSRDPQFGPVILLGLGGILVEVLKDSVLALAPVGRAEAAAMVRSLRGRAVLDGPRGRPRADVPALIDTLVTVSHLAAALGDDLDALDVNPLLVLPEGRGVVAADALLVPARA